MALLIREIVGWLIVVAGLILVGFVLQLALNRSVLEAMALSLPATIVFRSGVGLVKLAAAGRIAAAVSKDEPPPRSPERNR